MTNLNPADLQNMKAHEVAGLADIDVYSVRAEGERRQTIAEKKLARLTKQIAAARAEMEQAASILIAAHKEMARA